MNGSRFIYRRAVEGELRIIPATQGALELAAQTLASEARRNAPVDQGEYRDSIGTELEVGPQGARSYVVATALHAPYVEFGTEDTPTFAVFRRSGDMIARFVLRR